MNDFLRRTHLDLFRGVHIDKRHLVFYSSYLAAKLKLSVERQVLKLNNTERTLYEELHLVRAEIDLLTEQLQDLKDKLSESSYQITKMEIQKAAEKTKMDIFISELNNHKMDFNKMFAEERKETDLRNKVLEAREADEQELEHQRQKNIQRQSELQASEAAAVEEEARLIEQECAVLKKRNNAVMLKLRRKLVQTEDARRELINQQKEN